MSLHTRPSPFPARTTKGIVIVDERCACGQLRSEHADTFLYGHGPCHDSDCPQYRWAESIRGEATEEVLAAALARMGHQ